MKWKAIPRTYRQILLETLESRCQKNARYSLRTFARDLGISAPRLSRVLNGHLGFSRQAANEVAKKLNLSLEERELFCTLVESEHARASVTRASAQKRSMELSSAFQTLSIDSFRVISDWYHLAILELTLVQGFQSEPSWISRQLGITETEAKAAVERLLRMELLKMHEGRLCSTGSNFVNPKGTPSDAVRKFHSGILARAQQAIELQTSTEREFANLTFAFDEEELPQMRKFIREFTNRMSTKMASSPKRTRVYNLSIQFFALQTKSEKPMLIREKLNELF